MNSFKHIRTGRIVYWFIWTFLYLLFLAPAALYSVDMFHTVAKGTLADIWILVGLVVVYEICKFFARVISQTIIYLAYPKCYSQILDDSLYRQVRKEWRDRRAISDNLKR